MGMQEIGYGGGTANPAKPKPKDPNAAGNTTALPNNGTPDNIYDDPYAGTPWQMDDKTATGGYNYPAPQTFPDPIAPGTGPVPATTKPGLLSEPGPYEKWAAEHGGDFNGPSNAESLYGKYGAGLMDDKSNSESLYGQGIGQLNPYYDYASRIGTKAINDAAAAHGGFSSTALTQIGNLNANLRGQQAMKMADLAKQADDAKMSRYGLGQSEAMSADKGKLDRTGAAASIYSNWQDKEEGRLTGALSGQMGISNAEAAQMDKFYSNLIESGKYDAEAINAALQAAGVDPNSAFGKDLISLGGTIVKAYASK
jgi:hypothetical protein